MDTSNSKRIAAFVIIAIILVLIIGAIILLVMYFTSTGLFKVSAATFKSGFASREQRLKGSDPLVVFASDVDILINMYETQTNIDAKAAYQVFDEFLRKHDKTTPQSAIDAANVAKQHIVLHGDSIGMTSNEQDKFVYILYKTRSLLASIFDSIMLMSEQAGGVDMKMQQLVDQRMNSKTDNATLEWMSSIAVSSDEHDLREFAIDALSGADREIGSADAYSNWLSDNKEFTGATANSFMNTVGRNGKLPIHGATFNRGNIPDMGLNDVDAKNNTTRSKGNMAGIITSTVRDIDTYNPYESITTRRY